ncbi:MAG: glycosyltransferase family 4 protein [Dehalococcoidia bacterium]
MKVCFLLHQGNMYSGGQGVYVHHVTKEMAALGNEVHVIAGPPYPELAEGVVLHRVQNYSVYRLFETRRAFFYGRPLYKFFHPVNFYELASSIGGMFSVMTAFSFRAYDKLHELAPSHRFDIVHDVQGLGYGVLLIKANGWPVVANIHHPLQVDRMNSMRQARRVGEKIRWAKFYPFFMQEIVARRVDRIITGSGNSAESIGREFGLAPEQVDVIYDGVDTEAFRPLELPKRPNSILYVGNSDDRNKGARYLIEALGQLKDRLDFHLTVVDRPTAEMVPRLARELGIEDRVTLAGRVSHEELVRLYNESQLLASPSLYEGFGLPAAEAMACGTPVIATTAGAFPEVIEDGTSGVLVSPGDAHVLANAIEQVMRDSGLRRRLGQEGRRRISDHFSWRETATRTLALYQQVRLHPTKD